jgi:NCAIR mutase (PurE)-related protein
VDPRKLRELLENVRDGKVSVEDAVRATALLPFEDMGHARVDHHRELRTGLPEVILAEGKSVEQVLDIAASMTRAGSRVIVTRVQEDVAARIEESFPKARRHTSARMVSIDPWPLEGVPGVAVLTGGTSDIPVAEEAAVTAELMGNVVERHFDVGVAGLHRLLEALPSVSRARVVVAVAGMDGALPSVTAGLVASPVIAVPTSVGYGAAFGGVSAMLTMLNSCAPGVCVVNIDNGFGAGVLASMINRGLSG